ncbi:MAG TPA: ABC transporter ATP-binding protein, partial [Acidimicrobiales bacterium]|nr:ABC transporter ATP-binding protein [Acidimicrobiales bacterium]
MPADVASPADGVGPADVATPADGGGGRDRVVECDGLVVRYGATIAVDGLSFGVGRGEVLALLGPNGAGKTSTLQVLEGYRRPDGGSARVLGLDPFARHGAVVAHIGVMLQRGGLYPMLGPRRLLRLFASYYERPEDPRALLELLGLRRVADTPWRHLSGGEQQRTSLALALVGRPELLFLDEPTAGVDPQARLVVRSVVDSLRERGACVLLTTHELAEAERLADRVVILHRGRAAAAGTPAELAALGEAELTFGAPGGLDTLALAGVLGAGVTEESPGRYRVAAAGSPELTATLAAWMAERGIGLRDLRAGRSLED